MKPSGTEQTKWAAKGILTGVRRTIQRPADIPLALRIGLFLLSIPRRLDRKPLGELLAELETARRLAEPDAAESAGRVSRIRQAWLASPLLRSRNTCYLRAITLYRFLDPDGRKMRIHFGVEPGIDAADRIRGHAWVTVDGSLLEAPEPVIAGRVKEIYSYPAA